MGAVGRRGVVAYIASPASVGVALLTTDVAFVQPLKLDEDIEDVMGLCGCSCEYLKEFPGSRLPPELFRAAVDNVEIFGQRGKRRLYCDEQTSGWAIDDFDDRLRVPVRE